MTDDDTDLEVPDVYNHGDLCLAWKRKPSVIGSAVHAHVCRHEPDHPGPHICICGTEF